MKLDSLNDIKKLIDVCRKAGVDSIKIDGFELKLGELPETRKYVRREKSQGQSLPAMITDGVTTIDENSLSEEDMLFWSADPRQGQGGN